MCLRTHETGFVLMEMKKKKRKKNDNFLDGGKNVKYQLMRHCYIPMTLLSSDFFFFFFIICNNNSHTIHHSIELKFLKSNFFIHIFFCAIHFCWVRFWWLTGRLVNMGRARSDSFISLPLDQNNCLFPMTLPNTTSIQHELLTISLLGNSKPYY